MIGNRKRQHFGEVEAAFMRAVDNRGVEICRYNLAEDPAYNNMCTMMFGEVYRKDNGWKFRALGDAYPTDSFADVLGQYLPQMPGQGGGWGQQPPGGGWGR